MSKANEDEYEHVRYDLAVASLEKEAG